MNCELLVTCELHTVNCKLYIMNCELLVSCELYTVNSYCELHTVNSYCELYTVNFYCELHIVKCGLPTVNSNHKLWNWNTIYCRELWHIGICLWRNANMKTRAVNNCHFDYEWKVYQLWVPVYLVVFLLLLSIVFFAFLFLFGLWWLESTRSCSNKAICDRSTGTVIYGNYFGHC